MNGAAASLASRRAISVLPTPVGPIIRMFFGNTSSRKEPVSCSRRQRLRSAMETARLASDCPTMKRSSSETISRGEKSVIGPSYVGTRRSASRLEDRRPGLPLLDRLEGMDQHQDVQRQIVANVQQHREFERDSERNRGSDRQFP